MTDSALMRLCLQRGDASDCAIASLASLTGVPYEDVLRAVAQVDPRDMGRTGLWVRQIEAAAAVLGHPLRRRRAYDLEEDTGLLSVVMPTAPDHMVLLLRGLVIEGDGTVWDADAYLGHHRAKAGVLLVPADECQKNS